MIIILKKVKIKTKLIIMTIILVIIIIIYITQFKVLPKIKNSEFSNQKKLKLLIKIYKILKVKTIYI